MPGADEDILTWRADRIALSHKDYDERLVLVRASDLAKMEADLAALRKRFGVEPLSLRGILRINGDPEEVLTGVRRRQAILWEAKLKSFSAQEDVEQEDVEQEDVEQEDVEQEGVESDD